jgi:hypothetical protein
MKHVRGAGARRDLVGRRRRGLPATPGGPAGRTDYVTDHYVKPELSSAACVVAVKRGLPEGPVRSGVEMSMTHECREPGVI